MGGKRVPSPHGIFIEPGSVDVRLGVFSFAMCATHTCSGAGSLLKIREEKSGAAGNALRGGVLGLQNAERRADDAMDGNVMSLVALLRKWTAEKPGKMGGEAVCRITVEAPGVVVFV